MSPFPLGILSASGAGVAFESDFELLETTILDADTASVSFTSLNSTYGTDYKHLQLRMTVRTDRAATNSQGKINFNSDFNSNYISHRLRGNGSNVTSSNVGGSFITISDGTPANGTTSSVFAGAVIDILDPFNNQKNTTTRNLFANASTTYYGSGAIELWSGLYNSTSSIDSIEISDAQSSNFVIGSRFSLYGIKAA